MTRFDRFALPLALATMALAAPLLDLLGRNAEFFLSRRSPRIDVIVFAVVIGLGIPLLFGALGWAISPLGRWPWLILIGLLGAVLARQVLRPLGLPDGVRTSLALVGGVGIGAAGSAWSGLRTMARYLSVAPLVVLAIFFFATPTGAVVRSSGAVIGASATPADPVPIVIIGFDEFPVASIMRGDGSLNTEQYPNLARVARDGTWFRNTVGVEQQTEQAFPAILSGQIPRGDRPPYAGEYPNTIFSLLADSYDFTVIEAITQLCPEAVCGTPAPPAPAGRRAQSLLRDSAVVSGHLFLPDFVSSRLPPIEGRWGQFGTEVAGEFSAVAAFREQMDGDRRNAVADLVTAIDHHTTGRPFFGFLHILMPHHPWQYLPTGQAYPLIAEKSPGTTRTGWGDDQWLLDQGIQRHLLQVGYTDHALGEILDALDRQGMYDDAIVVVIADHGIAIEQNVFHQRYITPESVGQVAAVPLLIKGPGMVAGAVDDRRAETIDVIPTIADMLDVELPWRPDGVSLLGPITRTSSTMRGPQGSVTFGIDGVEKLAVAADIARAFPTGNPYELRPPGAPDLAGESVDLPGLGLSERTWALDRPEWFENVDPVAPTIPTRITGRLDSRAGGSEILAVVINGRIGALVRSYLDPKGVPRFQAMIPPETLRQGDNIIELVEVDGDSLRLIHRS